MEEKVASTPSADGRVDDPVSSIEAVHQVLTAGERKPTFMRNIGLTVAPKGRTPARSMIEAQLLADQARNKELCAALEDMQRDKEDVKETILKSERAIQVM